MRGVCGMEWQRAQGTRQRAESREQRVKDKGQKTEDREQRTENRGQRAKGTRQRVRNKAWHEPLEEAPELAGAQASLAIHVFLQPGPGVTCS